MRFLFAIAASAFLTPMAFGDDETDTRVRVALALAASKKSVDPPVPCACKGLYVDCTCEDGKCGCPRCTYGAAPPLSYTDARAQAIKENKPLVVWVHIRVAGVVTDVPGCVTCDYSGDLFGKEPGVVIARPDNKGDLDLVQRVFNSTPKVEEILVIAIPKPMPQRRLPVGAYVRPLWPLSYQNCGPHG